MRCGIYWHNSPYTGKRRSFEGLFAARPLSAPKFPGSVAIGRQATSGCLLQPRPLLHVQRVADLAKLWRQVRSKSRTDIVFTITSLRISGRCVRHVARTTAT